MSEITQAEQVALARRLSARMNSLEVTHFINDPQNSGPRPVRHIVRIVQDSRYTRR
jgi:hypothetical protein